MTNEKLNNTPGNTMWIWIGCTCNCIVPYSSQIVKPAYASNGVNKIAICDVSGNKCADIGIGSLFNGLYIETMK